MAYDIISDIHGCYDEMTALIQKLGYTIKNGVPVHEEGRVLVFAGDLTDRGPKSIEVIRFVAGAYEKGAVRYVPGNHCNKLYRYLKGNPVKVMHGLETTAAELEELSKDEKNQSANSL